MRLGIGTFTYPWAIGVPGREPQRRMTPMDLLREAVRLQVRIVQFCDNLPLDQVAKQDLNVCESFAQEHGLRIELGVRGTDPALLMRYLTLARRFGCDFLRIVVTKTGSQFDAKHLRGNIAKVMPSFARAKVKIAFENHDWHSLEQLAQLVKEWGPGRAGFCLDTVNSLGFRAGLEGVVMLLAPDSLSLHLKDYTMKRVPSQLGFLVEGCAVGAGEVDVPWVLKQPRLRGRDVNAIIEIWPPEAGTLEETIAAERTLAEASVKYARQFIVE
jgi:sugar phosphate isomerase/epimerase